MYNVIIIGGGLAGLINAITLARKNWKVLLAERKSYPFHRVCGEYISNEVKPFLQSIDCYPKHLDCATINRFQLTSTSGKSVEVNLELGGFGISRYKLDNYLAKIATQVGVDLQTDSIVSKVSFREDSFDVELLDGRKYNGVVVIGAFGKRSVLDKSLDRDFMKKRSPYVGVKYHVITDMADDIVALHNFKGGYCGISKIENERHNLCYLASRELVKKAGNISTFEQEVLTKNPWLADIFKNSEFLFDQPEVINEISFSAKEPVYDHVLMSGDAAGMIAPLCGNGMAMAIHSAKTCSEIVDGFLKKEMSRNQMELAYSRTWRGLFARRLWLGRNIQKLFGSGGSSDFAVDLLRKSSFISNLIIKQTHGKPF